MTHSPEKEKNKTRKKKDLLSNIAIIVLFVIGLGVLLYPTISDMWNRWVNRSLISDYDKVISELTEEDFSKIWAEAEEYNKQHVVNTFTDVFENEEYVLHHPYDEMLNPTGNHIMGYIEIPKIQQKLAIGHGTGNEILQKGVGHVEGTSLPIGGPSTHAVLAGHRGLPNAKIFSDLDQVEKGDKFFLYILNDILAYEVDQIEIVLPNDDSFLQIEEGQDLVTLLTCTPYSVNSHRMLVRGHRIPYNPEDIGSERGKWRLSERDRPLLIAIAGLLVVLIIILSMRLYYGNKKRKEEQEETRQRIERAEESAIKAAEEAGKAAKAAEEAKEAAILVSQTREKHMREKAVGNAKVAAKDARESSDAANEYADEILSRRARRKDD